MSACCPGGKYLVSARGTVEQWELETGRQVQRYGTDPDVWWRLGGGSSSALAISPDGRILALVSSASWDPVIQLRELLTGKNLGGVDGHQGRVESVAFSSDGCHLLTTGEDGTVLIWDATATVRRHLARTVTLAPSDLLRLWNDLGAEKEATALRAVERLVEAPRQALPWLAERLRPVTVAGIEPLVADLESPAFARRRAAMAELRRREFAARPALRRVLKGKPSLEQRRRVELLLPKLEEPMTVPEVLRAWRSVAVLEQIGTDEAKALLQRLAGGSPDARLTQVARAALGRWSMLPRVRPRPAER
jgi:hypothetical protein